MKRPKSEVSTDRRRGGKPARRSATRLSSNRISVASPLQRPGTTAPAKKHLPSERTRVFVYGTLLAGESNHHLIASSIYAGTARTKPAFTLYDLDDYPALVAHGRSAIEGDIYEVDNATLARLDRLEGHPQVYRRKRIRLEDDSFAFAYLMPLARVKGHSPIRSGSWRARQAGRRGMFTTGPIAEIAYLLSQLTKRST